MKKLAALLFIASAMMTLSFGALARLCSSDLDCDYDERCEFVQVYCVVAPCPPIQQCIARDDLDVVDIDEGCPGIFEPVCGEDFLTYINDCWAEIDGVLVISEGFCPDEFWEDEDAGRFEPQVEVCGSDGRTYAGHAAARRARVEVIHEGGCDLVVIDEPEEGESTGGGK